MIIGKSEATWCRAPEKAADAAGEDADPGSANPDAFHVSRSTTATDKSAIRFIEIPSD